MPLSKKRKAEYMRGYRQRIRYHVLPNDVKPVIPDEVRHVKSDEVGYHVLPSAPIPIYNPRLHRPGDTVRINGKVIVIPELDGDGQPIPT